MPPAGIEIAKSLFIYDSVTDTWSTGSWNIFTDTDNSHHKAINISTLGVNSIITGSAGKKIFITSIMFTVGGAVNVTLLEGGAAMSGAMDFGGTSEPRGMVSNFGFHGIELGNGKGFSINLSAAVQVSGVVCYQLR